MVNSERWLALAAVCCLCLICGCSANQPDELKVKRITIVDEAGNPRIFLGTKDGVALINIFGADSEPCIVLTARSSGTVAICDADGKPRISIYHDPDKNESNLRLDDRSGVTRTQVINVGSNAGFTVKSADDKPQLGIADNGIIIYNDDGRPRWSAP